MDPEMASQTKRRKSKVSKNRKKSAWRSFSNVEDVEDFMDEQREELRLGGAFHEKEDHELFEIDTNPNIRGLDTSKIFVKEESIDDTFSRIHNASLSATGKGTKAKDEGFSLWKELKCFNSLSGARGDPEPKPHLQKSLERNSSKLKRLSVLVGRRKSTKQPHARATGKVVKTAAVPDSGDHPKDRTFNRNLWADVNVKQVPVERAPAISKPARLPPTMRGLKKSGITIVEIPHPGASYNPDQKEHENLLAAASANATEKAKEASRLTDYRKTRKSGNKLAADVWMEEMEQGLPGAKEKPEEFGNSTLPESDSQQLLDCARNQNRKTKQERKRHLVQEEKKVKRTEAKLKRTRENDVFSVKSILKRLQRKDDDDAKRRLIRKKKLEDPKRIKRLGKHKFIAQDLDVKLNEEMVDNLRTLRPEGNLLFDRYKSLQKRNIVEPRLRNKNKRKYKLKTYQIEGRKAFTE